MKLEQLKRFNHGSAGIAYSVIGLTNSQYDDIYLQACNRYNSVKQYVTMSWANNKVNGYILCK